MTLYHPELLYLLILAGALVTAALTLIVTIVWPAARTGPALAGEEAAAEAAADTPPKVPSLR
jgi:hypothetical protein